MDLQWLKSDEAKKISRVEKEKAWKNLKQNIPLLISVNLQRKQILLIKNMQPLK